MELCGTDSIGANKFLYTGLSHNKFTRIMEGLDNSQKALISSEYKNIVLNLTDTLFYIKDNGSGMNDIDSNLKLFKVSNDNTNSLSKCGMGLNSLLTVELQPNVYFSAYIISSYMEDNDVKLTGRKLSFKGELLKSILDFSQKERDIVNTLFSSKTGTIILIDKDKRKLSDILNTFELDNIKEYDEDLMNNLQYILEGSECNYIYNNNIITPNKYIKEEDKIMISCDIYYKVKDNQEINYYVKDTKEYYTCNKNIDNKYTSVEIDESYIVENNLNYLGKYSVYMHNGTISCKDTDFKSYHIQYIIPGLRTIGFKILDAKGIKTHSHFAYIKSKLEIKDINFIKIFLQGKKTPNNIWDIEMDERYTKLHRVLSRITINNNILSIKNYIFGNNEDSKSNKNEHYLKLCTGSVIPNDEENLEKKDSGSSNDEENLEKKDSGSSNDEENLEKKDSGSSEEYFQDDQGSSEEEIQIKDKKRYFTKDQGREILLNQDSRCKICSIKLDDMHILYELDHIIPHCKGGLTNVENGRALCRNCHKGRELPWSNDTEKNKEHIELLIKMYTEAYESIK